MMQNNLITGGKSDLESKQLSTTEEPKKSGIHTDKPSDHGSKLRSPTETEKYSEVPSSSAVPSKDKPTNSEE